MSEIVTGLRHPTTIKKCLIPLAQRNIMTAKSPTFSREEPFK
jgi:hypothetical protein